MTSRCRVEILEKVDRTRGISRSSSATAQSSPFAGKSSLHEPKRNKDPARYFVQSGCAVRMSLTFVNFNGLNTLKYRNAAKFSNKYRKYLFPSLCLSYQFTLMHFAATVCSGVTIHRATSSTWQCLEGFGIGSCHKSFRTFTNFILDYEI